MKFIADSMLGRLARWLRLLGFDTLYSPEIRDSRLIRIAREEERILLTRDTRLVKIRGLKNYFLIHSNNPFEQLSEIIKEFDLAKGLETRLSGAVTGRCSLCNCVLRVISKEEARTHVPEYVYRTTGTFRYCYRCNKYYWEGTHYKRMREKLQGILYN